MYEVLQGLDIGKKRLEAGDTVSADELGKSFKWLEEQGLVRKVTNAKKATKKKLDK